MPIDRWLRLAIATALLALLTPASVGEAQAWLSDRSRAEGPGFRIGDFELHPGLGVEIGYDTNLYYTADDSPVYSARDTAILRATAHLLFSTRGAQRAAEGESGGGSEQEESPSQPSVVFRGGLSGAFYHFFADNGRTNMEVDAQLALGILPGRTFSLDITEDFGRSIRPFTENSAIAASYARIQNNAGIRANFATSGDVLKVAVGYNFGLDYFEDALFQYGNNFRHTISLSETFRFLPQTAIIHDTNFVVGTYFTDPAMVTSPMVNDGYMLRTRVGLNGAFTPEFSVLAMVGYAAGFFETRLPGTFDQEYDSIVAQIEARWQIERNARLIFGYDRDFRPSFIGNWYRQDRGYAQFQYLIGGAFLLGVEASVGGYGFGQIADTTGAMVGMTYTRSDVRVTARLFGEYRVTDWLGINGTLAYTGNFTDYIYNVEDMGGGGIVPVPGGFNKFEMWLGARVFY